MKDPFASHKSMADDHPVMIYINWQIASHEKRVEHLRGGWFNSSVKRMKKTLADQNTKQHGVPEQVFYDFEYTLDEMKRVEDQLSRLKRERLRLQKVAGFKGNSSYLL